MKQDTSRFFTDKAIADEEWTLDVLTSMARGAQFPNEIASLKEAAAEAVAAWPTSNAIRFFIAERGLE